MSPPTEALQRISRLAPLAEVLARVDALAAPVAPQQADLAAAQGRMLAADVALAVGRPSAAIALRDGWAVASELVSDAGPYAPALLMAPPVWVEVGKPMPAGTDAVLPLDAVTVTQAGAEAHAPAAPGDGVLAAEADAAAGAVLRRAGERLRTSDAAILRLAGISRVQVREPRLKIFCASVALEDSADAISPLLAHAVESEGGRARIVEGESLESALLDDPCDATLTVGGTGSGRRDTAVKTLARVGRVEIHGFGLAPGETAAFGTVGERPVLMLPGRLDAALAVWLVVGRRLLARLAGRIEDDPATAAKLLKKVASTVGLAELIPVRRVADGIEPLASGTLMWNALARADGWILVPPESEGFAAGAMVEMRPLP